MDQKIMKDLSDSAYDFKRLIWPEISEWIGGGELVPVESVTENNFAVRLDQLSGIDAWQVLNGSGIRGLGSRIQWGTPWETFTIRKERSTGTETEKSKRKRAIDEGWLYPYWTSQGYITERRTGDLLFCCLVKTEDLYKFMESNPEKILSRSGSKI